MPFARTIIIAALAATAVPASASVIALGNSSARLCYKAAEERTALPQVARRWCDEALAAENLNRADTVATYVNRGILTLRSGDAEAAVQDFDRALALDRDEPEAYLNKGAALLNLPERTAEAAALFSTAIEKRTRRPAMAYYGRAVAYETAGDTAAAYHDYRQASRLAPKWREPRAELARFVVRPR
ncbi:MAG TPA: tetratricopeptide repeat protein [Allosphingosinicella sp.]|jgi:Flp pilus assembly protein TadD